MTERDKVDEPVVVENAADNESNEAPSTQLVRPSDLLPTSIPVLPNPTRPFFPGQVMPLMLPADKWTKTLKKITEEGNGILGVTYTTSHDMNKLDVASVQKTGTACRIIKIQPHEDNLHVVLTGDRRFQVIDWLSTDMPLQARVRYVPEPETHDGMESKAYVTAIINTIKELLPLNPLYGEELKIFLDNFQAQDPSRLADFAASLTTSKPMELQQLLETVAVIPRLERALVLLKKEVEVAQAQMEIRQHVEQEMESRQREAFLREQLKFIQKELGIEKDDRTAELERFQERLETLELSEEAANRIDEELDKFTVLEPGSPEYTVTRNYLDWLTILPWGKHSEEQLDVDAAEDILQSDHEGLQDVKERIIEFISVGKMRGGVGGGIVLLVGPPGVGKTSLGKSVARALGREFYRFSLGGMRDEAEIKGHRRTYIGAMPGKFMQAMKDAGASNPVIVLDEIDKIGASFQGDPASALLEVLDPAQNSDFLDHYLDVRFDLSKVLFICTANQLDTIPGPLLDRMEVVRLSGYLAEEKLNIAQKHLIPRLLKDAGVKRTQISIDKAAVRQVIEDYAREAGVRQLEKSLSKIIRKAVTRLVRAKRKPKKIRIQASDVVDYLGKAFFTPEERKQSVGVITGLAWTAMGGATLSIEATRTHEFSRGLNLTGQLGDVMKESAQIAYSYVMGNAERYNIATNYFEKSFLHLHVPAGATPKDGPSAGVTMATAIVSLATGKKCRRRVAMTGELTLTGEVLPVGGIREKVIAAKRIKLRHLILPEANRGDFDELPDYIRKGVDVVFASHFDDVVSAVL